MVIKDHTFKGTTHTYFPISTSAKYTAFLSSQRRTLLFC